jgi:LytS/YehU family sensor histidine kinase
MIWAISMVYYLMFQLQESKQHAERVYASALQSELSFLKAQINPHFLFNTLNNIYALTLKKSEDAPKAVMKLSNLMRQLTDDAGVDFVPFEQEEKFIRDYIELQEMRLTDKTNVRYETNGQFKRLNIAPRLLIPFIDNAFKYGVSNRNASEIIIRLDFNDTRLTCMVQNALHKGYPENQEESTGVGLENAHRRLDLLYKGKYTLKNTQTKESYLVQLEIDLS